MKNCLILILLTTSICAFSQSISVIGNYPLIHKSDYCGIIDAQIQLNLIETSNYNWEFGVNFDYLTIKNQISNNTNILKATLTIENNLTEIGSSLGLKLVGDVGYFYEKSKNGLALGLGIVFDRMIFDKTQLLINIKENMLLNSFNYLNLGVGIRRFI